MKSIRINRHKLKYQLEIQSMVLPGIIFLIIFAYIPMAGNIIAFKEVDLDQGSIFGGAFVGLKYFNEFFSDPKFYQVLRNTLGINILQLIIGFPAPIIFALLLNELISAKFKKKVQTLSYLPHFVSWVIFSGLIITLLSTGRTGLVNNILMKWDIIERPIDFLASANNFWWIVVISGMVKGIGFGAIIYIAAISGVDPQLYEAATVDGVGRFKKIWYITLPSIMGTIVIMLIFQISAMLNTGVEQVLMLQNDLNSAMSETIDTYVYKVGIKTMRFSYASAVGVFKSCISLVLVLGANYTSKKITEKGLF